MNKQKAGKGIEWTHVYGRPGYTANPVQGCQHDCRWQMPDGTVAECYAKAIAEGVARKAYPQGFEHIRFNPKELGAIKRLKTPAGIFIDSMSDLFGRGVKPEWIDAVLSVMHDSPQHIFFILTKNPPRLLEYKKAFPANAWVGISSTPDWMFGNLLTPEQKWRWYARGLEVLREIDVPVRWSSIEPLSWNVAPEIHIRPGVLQWAVIGAASQGRNYFAPDAGYLKQLMYTLDVQNIPIFFKGNMKSSSYAQHEWRQAYPNPDGRGMWIDTQAVKDNTTKQMVLPGVDL